MNFNQLIIKTIDNSDKLLYIFTHRLMRFIKTKIKIFNVHGRIQSESKCLPL